MSEAPEPIIVEQTFRQPKETIWKSITQHRQMVQWFFEDIPDFQPVVGFETQFNVSNGEREFNHLWKITETVLNQRIVYDWRYEGFPGQVIVTFELLDESGGTRLRVTAEGGESFPQEIPEFKRESGVAGWQYLIQGNLRDYLESDSEV